MRVINSTICIPIFSRQQFICREIGGNYPSTDRFFTCQISVENAHILTSFELPTEKAVANMLETEESVRLT